MPTIRVPSLCENMNQAASGNRKPTCARCRNHMKIIPLKGHKRFCPYAACECDSCNLVSQRQQIMAKQQSHRRKLIFNAEEKPRLDKQMQSLEEGAYRLPGLYCCGKCGATFNTPDELVWHIQRKHLLIFVEGPNHSAFYLQSPSTSKVSSPPPSPIIDVVSTPAPEHAPSPRRAAVEDGSSPRSESAASIAEESAAGAAQEPLCLATSMKPKLVKFPMSKASSKKAALSFPSAPPSSNPKLSIRRPWMEESNLFPWLSYSSTALQNMTALQQCSICWPPSSRWAGPNFYLNAQEDISAMYRNLHPDRRD